MILTALVGIPVQTKLIKGYGSIFEERSQVIPNRLQPFGTEDEAEDSRMN